MKNSWECVIGLEIHAQMNTRSKMFSPDSTSFEEKENTTVHPISLGFPGTLPCLNKDVISLALKVGKAFHCQVQKKSVLERKNYFYPDLPKGYQISQFKIPLFKQGYVEFYHQEKVNKINIERIHLEEDAGKLIHQSEHSLVDFNRSGMPLLEIISHPEISSPKEAADYARMVRNILVHLEVCDGNLQEGSMRFDCNISLRPQGSKKLGTKVELKNLNSFRFIEKSLSFEIERQTQLLNQKKLVTQETRLYNPKKNQTFSMRTKEQASDYRYFPEPDLPPLVVEQTDESIDKELPIDQIKRFCSEYKIPLSFALLLTEEIELANYFETALKKTSHAQTLCKWVVNEMQAYLKDSKIEIKECLIAPEEMAELVNQIEQKLLSSKMAKNVFQQMWKTGKPLKVLVKEMNLTKLDDEESLSKIINQVLTDFPEQCEQYRNGKTTVYKFLMGQVMKISKGQADPEKANQILEKKLKS